MTNKLKQTAAARGFIAGFTSPFLVFIRPPAKFSYKRRNTVRRAWQEVGDELIEATKVEGNKVGKNRHYRRQELRRPLTPKNPRL